MSLRYSIIIPTRERADVLQWALKTCTMQAYENLEIIVSDNYSQDNTEQIVKSTGDTRIRYYNTEQRLSMSHNWEFALEKATGDYITILGDDDGFVPNAIEDINKILSKAKSDALCWHQSRYFWPGNVVYPHELFVVLRNRVVSINAYDNLCKVINHQKHYSSNPWLYSGFVHKSVIEKVKANSKGIFFHSMIPDVYSGLAIGSQIDTYMYSTGAFSIAGNSSHSNGMSCISSKEKNRESFNKFLSENPIPFHTSLELVASSIPLLVYESSLQLADLGLIDPQSTGLNLKKTLVVCINDALQKEEAMKTREIDGLKKTAEKNDLSWADLYNSASQMHINTSKLKYNLRQSLIGKKLNGDKIGVSNIYEAALFHDRFKRKQFTIGYDLIRMLSELKNGK